MVKGLTEFNRRFTAIPKRVRVAAIDGLEKAGKDLAGQISRVNPAPSRIEVGTGNGAEIKRRGASGGGISQAVYAKGKSNSGVSPRWFEFGTRLRRQRRTGRFTGVMPPQPFFWPIYRANKRRIRARVTRAITRAIRSS